MELPKPLWFDRLFPELLAGRDLELESTTEAFRDILSGRVDDSLIAAFVTALRIKGESSGEIAGAAIALREQMIRLTPVNGPTLDTCGTGGDDSGTFNISTAASFVVAGAGVPTVKHGNRSVSSRSGSADVLRELGVDIEAGPDAAQRCLDRVGFAFCYTPQFHLGTANVSKLRRKLAVRTIFNLVGPLANPASAEYQLLGVGKPELLDPITGAVARLGTRRAILACGDDGLDEISLAAPTRIRIVENDEFKVEVWTNADFGLEPVSMDQIRVDSPRASAAMIMSVLNDEDIPAKRIVIANAAAALFAADAVHDLREGVERARESVRSGAARRILERLRREMVPTKTKS